jgi:hypothetical protein
MARRGTQKSGSGKKKSSAQRKEGKSTRQKLYYSSSADFDLDPLSDMEDSKKPDQKQKDELEREVELIAHLICCSDGEKRKSGTGGNTPQSFHHFTELPLDIQSMVWNSIVLEEPGSIYFAEFHMKGEGPGGRQRLERIRLSVPDLSCTWKGSRFSAHYRDLGLSSLGRGAREAISHFRKAELGNKPRLVVDRNPGPDWDYPSEKTVTMRLNCKTDLLCLTLPCGSSPRHVDFGSRDSSISPRFAFFQSFFYQRFPALERLERVALVWEEGRFKLHEGLFDWANLWPGHFPNLKELYIIDYSLKFPSLSIIEGRKTFSGFQSTFVEVEARDLDRFVENETCGQGDHSRWCSYMSEIDSAKKTLFRFIKKLQTQYDCAYWNYMYRPSAGKPPRGPVQVKVLMCVTDEENDAQTVHRLKEQSKYFGNWEYNTRGWRNRVPPDCGQHECRCRHVGRTVLA